MQLSCYACNQVHEDHNLVTAFAWSTQLRVSHHCCVGAPKQVSTEEMLELDLVCLFLKVLTKIFHHASRQKNIILSSRSSVEDLTRSYGLLDSCLYTSVPVLTILALRCIGNTLAALQI